MGHGDGWAQEWSEIEKPSHFPSTVSIYTYIEESLTSSPLDLLAP